MTTDTALAAGPAAQSPQSRPFDRLFALARRLPPWWPLVLCVLLGTLGGLGYGALRTPQYTATSYVVVNPGRGADTATALGFAHAYGRVVTNAAVLADAQAATGLPANDLRNRVQAVTSPDAPMIEIIGSDIRADGAATNANEVARALTAYANASATSTGVRLSILSKAPTPTAPASPSMAISGAVGACAGGLLGCLLLLVRPAKRRGAASVVPAPAARQSAQPAREGTR